MKKILLPIAAIAFALAACDSIPKFTITGIVEDMQSGEAYLLHTDGKSTDTLAQAVINDGKFVLTGNVTDITNAIIGVKGSRITFPVLLENAQYTAKLNLNKPVGCSVDGPKNQQIVSAYTNGNYLVNAAMAKLYKEYHLALKEQDTARIMKMGEDFKQLKVRVKATQDSLLNSNPDTYAAAYILMIQMSDMDSEELSKRFAKLGPNAQASDAGRKIADRIKKMTTVAIGQIAPDFTLNTPEGKPLSMHSIKAKVKIIDFWASWCGPCRGENPNVVKIYKEFHEKGLEILSVSLDDSKENWLKAIKNDQLTWNHVSDLQGWKCAAAQLYGVSGIPHLVVLDENNVIVAKNLRGDALRAKVAEFLE